MNADGSDQRRLSEETTSGHFMRWADDGSGVYHRAAAGEVANLLFQPLDDALAPPPLELTGAGFHISRSPDRSLILDVAAHRVLWVYPADGGERRRVFEFDDPTIRIDYPVWSPDGAWVVFDRAVYQGSDIWMLEGLD